MYKRNLYSTLLLLIVLPYIFTPVLQKATEIEERFTTKVAALVVRSNATSTVALLRRLSGQRASGTLTSAGVPDKGNYSLTANGQQTLNAEDFDALLEGWNSPAKKSGYLWVKAGEKYDIDAAIAFAMFEQESGAGSNPNWDASSMNPGNIMDANHVPVRYDGWGTGIDAMVGLLADYREGGITDVRGAISKWAPSSENRTEDYITYVEGQLDSWRAAKAGQFVAVGGDPNAPAPDPQVFQPTAVNLPAGEKARSVPMPMNGYNVYNSDTMEHTIRNSINSSPGLQSVTIAPGETWSFMQAWTVDVNTLATEYGVLGAGMCDVAGLYADTARKMGLGSVSYPDHRQVGVVLSLTPDSNVMVWGTPGVAGGADLTIVNDRQQTAKMAGVFEDGGATFVVYGWWV